MLHTHSPLEFRVFTHSNISLLDRSRASSSLCTKGTYTMYKDLIAKLSSSYGFFTLELCSKPLLATSIAKTSSSLTFTMPVDTVERNETSWYYLFPDPMFGLEPYRSRFIPSATMVTQFRSLTLTLEHWWTKRIPSPELHLSVFINFNHLSSLHFVTFQSRGSLTLKGTSLTT